ncbi:hypothetical protein BZM27_46815 [Paraburkholderia steynii]|uniref:Uncharacterized protein n=1 Tax=Paraburkholderia steynii TaxID=1245441 RepID=A0A4R0XCI4_9BURK|nr:hypothetical protein BZM27_46815 [Paraburkholderia steynii]
MERATSATLSLSPNLKVTASDANGGAFVSYSLKQFAHGGAASTSATSPLWPEAWATNLEQLAARTFFLCKAVSTRRTEVAARLGRL